VGYVVTCSGWLIVSIVASIKETKHGCVSIRVADFG
jgi:hypothetical protein